MTIWGLARSQELWKQHSGGLHRAWLLERRLRAQGLNVPCSLGPPLPWVPSPFVKRVPFPRFSQNKMGVTAVLMLPLLLLGISGLLFIYQEVSRLWSKSVVQNKVVVITDAISGLGKGKQASGFPEGSVVKNLPANAGDSGLIPGSGRPPGEGNGNPLQYSCLENPMDRGTW